MCLNACGDRWPRKRPSSAFANGERFVPDLTIRSTFIVGFPGETEADFSLLLDWLSEAELDRVGCFRYEPVDGAAANDLGAPVPDAAKDERWNRLMAHQQAISRRRLKRKVGRNERVIIDEIGPTVGRAAARATRPRSMAPSMWRAAGHSASAKSPR